MKETILNVVYDTETAQFLGTVESSCPSTDKRWYQADLYQTPSGYWFLAGEGGPETQFAVEHAGGRRTGSRGIIPLGRHKTMLWLIENDRIDILASISAMKPTILPENSAFAWKMVKLAHFWIET